MDMKLRYEQKLQLYKTQATSTWLETKFNVPERSIQVAGVILNFRGGFYSGSQDILKKLGVPAKYLTYLVVSTLVDTWSCGTHTSVQLEDLILNNYR